MREIKSLNYLVGILLSKNKINFDKVELRIQIESHPSYPSLHAITGVLDHFEIDNMALDIPQTEAVYLQLPDYFIAYLKIEDSQQEDFVFIHKKIDKVIVSLADGKKKTLSVKEFLKSWSGIILVVEKDELTIYSNTKNSFLRITPYLALTGVVCFLLITKQFHSIPNIILFAFSLLGVYISSILVKHELGIYSETVDKLCTSSKKTNCDAVLNSNGARVFGRFKLSDLSFVYFTSLSFIWLHSILNNTTFNIAILISLTTIPIIFYSIYYQAVVVKKWCPLCLATASVLGCQFLVSYFLYPLRFEVSTKGILFLITITMLTIISYRYIKDLIVLKISLSKKEIDFYKFKRKSSIFNALHQQKPILDTAINSNEIIFGSISAPIELLIITNPLCGFCKATHQAAEKLLNSNNKIKIIIRFNINTTDTENESYKIASALLNIFQKDIVACRNALHEIYSDNANVNEWLSEYKEYTAATQNTVLEVEKQWCIDNSINFTPAVYLNQKEYPKEYDLIDLNLFIDEITEQHTLLNLNKLEDNLTHN